LHDVAPATRASCERVLGAIEAVRPGLPLTLLAVPRYHCAPGSPGFDAWLLDRHLGGDELALHGYTHLDEGEPRGFVDRLRRRHYTRGEGEFTDLSVIDATQRITAGIRWFARLGLVPRGFVAPAWLMSQGTWEALRWLDLRYTCTLRHLVVLPDRRTLTSQSLVYSTSSAWRRQASLAWNKAVAAGLRGNPLLRLELHPHDADHAAIRRSWQQLLERHLDGRRPATLGEVAERHRLETDWDSLGSGLELDDEEHEPGGHGTDGGADQHVARVVQPEHHA
jgi:predicted deacetylase